MGRQSTFNAKDAAEIVKRLGTGEPLTHICADDWLPCDDTVRAWAEKDPPFGRAIARARESGFDAIALEALAIADAPNVTVDPETREPVMRDVRRDKLRVDTRLKLLAKWDPKRYGDATMVKHANAEGGDLPAPTSDLEIGAKLAAILEAAKARRDSAD